MPNYNKKNIFQSFNKDFNLFKNKWKNYFTIDFFDSVNFLLFILGTVALIIITLNNKIGLKDFLQGEILFLTLLAILQYTKETFWLKQVQQKTLFQQRAKDDYGLMPFLEFDISYSSERFFTIFNKGKGLAKDIEFTIEFGKKTYLKNNVIILADNTYKFNYLNDHKFLTDFGSMDKKLITSIKIFGKYRDLANRDYKFEILFKTDGTSFEVLKNHQKPNNWEIGKGL